MFVRERGGGCEFGAVIIPVIIPIIIPIILSHSVTLHCWLLAPMIHPMSSGSQGWAQVLGHSMLLGASLLFVIIVPPPSLSFSPYCYSPPLPLFPLCHCSCACHGCHHGWGWRWVLVGCSHCLPPIFLPSVVLCILVLHCWHWSAGHQVPSPHLHGSSSNTHDPPCEQGSQLWWWVLVIRFLLSCSLLLGIGVGI